MNNKSIRELKKKLKLSKIQKEIIVGLLLGDGHLETQNGGKTYRLKVEHSIRQKDYTEWLCEVFKNWVPGNIYFKKRLNGKNSVGFTTYSQGSFRFFGQQFYKDGKKTVPKIIGKLLSPIGLAVWFMDDGSLKSSKHRAYVLHTLGYLKEDIILMQGALSNLFDIKTIVHKQGDKWRIYIPTESAQKFEAIINPYLKMFTSMNHKLSNKMPKK